MIKRITKVKVEGDVVIQHPDGEIEESTEEVEELIMEEPFANVGLKVGMTISLGEFEYVRADVSLFMPSKTDKASLNATYKKVDAWVEKKMKKIRKELKR